MPNSTALEKLLKGETLSDEDHNAITPEDIGSLSVEQIDALPLGVKAKLNDAVKNSITGRREELRRLGEKNNNQNQEGDLTKRFLEEQTKRAEDMAFGQLQQRGMELTEEKKNAIREKRKKLNNGSVTTENIIEDFLEAAAAVDHKNLFSAQDKSLEFERNAAQFNAQGAGPAGTGGPNEEDRKKFSKEVWDWVADSKSKGISITPEQAKRVLEGGLTRKYKA